MNSLSKNPISYILTIFFSFIFLILTNGVNAQINVRPVSDFVNAQGSVLVSLGQTNGGELFGGKLFIWGSSLNDPLFRVDYAGTDDKSLISVGGPDVGTSYSGNITERPLADGRADVTIRLVTHNAIMFIVNASTFEENPPSCSNGGPPFLTLCPVVFGYNIVELANGVGQPTLGNSVMNITMVNTAPGAPIPDLLSLSFEPSPTGAYLKTITLKTTATGPLRTAFGVPEGTKGLATLDVKVDKNVDSEIVTLKALGN